MSASSRPPQRVLVVRVGRMRRGLPLAGLEGIAESARMTSVPQAPAAICGAVPFRGHVVPVLDAGLLLGDAPTPSGPLVFVRRGREVVALRVAEVLGVGQDDAAPVDLDALELPALPSRERWIEAAIHRAAPGSRREAARLQLRIAGRDYALTLAQVAEVVDDAAPVPVPWADPLLPSLLFRGKDPVAVVRMDLLLGLSHEPAGPWLVCRTEAGLIAFRIDAAPVLAARSDAPTLDLPGLLRALPAPGAPPLAAPPPDAAAEPFMAVMIEEQPCLLHLASVRSVAPHAAPMRLPGVRPPLIGARAMRGRVLPVLDLRLALSLPAVLPAQADIELLAGYASIVLPVQGVDTVVRLMPTAVGPGPGGLIPSLARIGNRRAWVLDAAALAQHAQRAA